jgi:uncharacterized membrane protein YhaH (DUF805 family)
LLSTLFSFRGTLDRRAYLFIALAAILVKHAMDLTLAGLVLHHSWTPLNYLIPLGVPVPAPGMSQSELVFVLTMATASIPFAWIGLAITVKRFRAIGWPPWLVILFFVPIANIASFAIAAVWPEDTTPSDPARNPWLARFVPRDTLGTAVFALIVTVVLGALCVVLGTKILDGYGWGLFAAVPFAQGALSAYFFNVHRARDLAESMSVAVISVVLTGLALLALALEGGLCIVMAMPLAVAFALVGAMFGHVIARPGRSGATPATLVLLLLAPTIMGAEAVVPRSAPLYVVRSSIEIDAPPAVVWQHVISFPELPPPTELPFLLGVAYPERARIDGAGVGSMRYCEFSTGSFVEPITAWIPRRKLAFNVASSPEPMREWSPYGRIDTAHLHNYMESKQGEFALLALPGGRTRLTGTTWYQHHLWPSTYWALWSDAIVHQIHMRVLQHIKAVSEATTDRPYK